MALTITHTQVAGTGDNPDVIVDGDDWDANHAIAGSVAASELTGYPQVTAALYASDSDVTIGQIPKTVFDFQGNLTLSNNDIAPSSTYVQAPWYWSNNEAWLAGNGNFGVSFLVQDTVLAGHTGHRETAHIRIYSEDGIQDNAYVALQTGASNTGDGSGQFFGLGAAASVAAGADATSEAVGAEFNTTITTAVQRKAGLQIIDVGSTHNAADGFDHAIIIDSNSGTGYRYGLDIREDGLVASTGIPIRIPNATSIYARNAADDTNIALIGLRSDNAGALFPAGAPAFFGGDITVERSAVGTSVTATVKNSGAGYAGLELFGDSAGWLLSKRLAADSPSHVLQWYYNSGGYTLKMSLSNAAILNLASGGAYQINSVQVVGARDTGWTAMTGTPDESTSYATGSVSLTQLAGRVMALQAALTTHGLIGA